MLHHFYLFVNAPAYRLIFWFDEVAGCSNLLALCICLCYCTYTLVSSEALANCQRSPIEGMQHMQNEPFAHLSPIEIKAMKAMITLIREEDVRDCGDIAATAAAACSTMPTRLQNGISRHLNNRETAIKKALALALELEMFQKYKGKLRVRSGSMNYQAWLKFSATSASPQPPRRKSNGCKGYYMPHMA